MSLPVYSKKPPKPLTPRELELLELLCDGHDNASIGHQLDISEDTVKRHLSNIMVKMHVNNRTHLAIKILNEKHQKEVDAIRKNLAGFDFRSN